MTIFLRLLGTATDAKAALLRGAIREVHDGSELATPDAVADATVFERNPAEFAEVPGSPFAYWVSDAVRAVFRLCGRFDADHVAVRGAYTADDFRFYRLVWEVDPNNRAVTRAETVHGRGYVAFAKGGAFSPWYADVHLVIRWHVDGAEAKAFLAKYRERKGWGTDWSACLNGHGHYFRPGLTWPRRTTSGLGLRVMPAGCIFADKGPAAFASQDDPRQLLALCGLLNSSTFRYLVAVQLAAADAAARSYEVGLIQQTPVPNVSEADVDALCRLARRAWCHSRTLDIANETSHAFLFPRGTRAYEAFQTTSGTLGRAALEVESISIQREIDARAFEMYEIGPMGRVAIDNASEKRIGRAAAENSDEDPPTESDDDDGDQMDQGSPETSETLVLSTYSWLVGVAFGRFDKRLATGERAIPPEPEPFDPLPSRSPGMWPDGESNEAAPAIMVDDPGHERDLAIRATAAAIGTGVEVGDDLRPWLTRDFFPFHIKMYSKSRRKAPIYWQLATPSASYAVWLYIHAFTKDTLYRVLNDFVSPKLAHEERRLAELGRNRDAAGAGERKQLAAQEGFVEELRAFRDEVARVAPLWNPDLDDGVIINCAPLLRLVPQHKTWEKECRASWDRLVAGEYDWAHLAMHLWPERVVPKCAEDRSLAIAHGLDELLWFEGLDGKSQPRKVDTGTVGRLIKERTSTAVKDALRSLMEAPAPSAGRGGERKKATKAAGPRRKRASSPPVRVREETKG